MECKPLLNNNLTSFNTLGDLSSARIQCLGAAEARTPAVCRPSINKHRPDQQIRIAPAANAKEPARGRRFN